MCGRLSLVKKKERGLFVEEDVVVVIKNTLRHLSLFSSSSSSHFLLFFCAFSPGTFGVEIFGFGVWERLAVPIYSLLFIQGGVSGAPF